MLHQKAFIFCFPVANLLFFAPPLLQRGRPFGSKDGKPRTRRVHKFFRREPGKVPASSKSEDQEGEQVCKPITVTVTDCILVADSPQENDAPPTHGGSRRSLASWDHSHCMACCCGCIPIGHGYATHCTWRWQPIVTMF